MLGSSGEPVEVWLADGRPRRFVWRGRMYTVMLVLDHVRGAGSGGGGSGTGEESTGEESTGEYSIAGDSECWRVEATPQRAVPPATYELCRDIATNRWSLRRG